MVTILKVYKNGCAPCERASAVLTQVETPFVLHELNIEDTKFAVRRKAKSLLAQYGTTNLPLLVFVNEEDKEYTACWPEQGDPTKEIIEAKLLEGEPKNDNDE